MLPERVVVLGASGHVGGAIAAAFARQGVSVIGHSSKTLDLTRDDFRPLDGIPWRETGLVFASALIVQRGQTLATFAANLTMAINIARYMQEHAPACCVYIGSDAVYGAAVNPVTEATPVAPAGYYALAKYAGERLVEWAALEAGVPLLSLRLTGVYGPGDPYGHYGPNSFAASVARERVIELFGQGEEEREHLYIDDIGPLAIHLLRAGATGLFNLAPGESRSLATICDEIQRLVPYEMRVHHLPRTRPITHRSFDIRSRANA